MSDIPMDILADLSFIISFHKVIGLTVLYFLFDPFVKSQVINSRF